MFPILLQDTRFNADIDLKTGYKTRSILSMPIHDLDGKVVGVAQAVNKIILKDEAFDNHDEKVGVAHCLVAICILWKNMHTNSRNRRIHDII